MNDVENLPYTVVLCRVRESGNLGSVCRAMKTMGLRRLILADCPAYDEALVAMMAVHAFDVYRSAMRFDTLHDALLGSSMSAGFSRRRGARRKGHSVPLPEFAQSIVSGGNEQVYLVFGNEKDGLSDAELSECSVSVHIPSAEAFPSLNIAQAVQVACYELRMAVVHDNRRRPRVAVAGNSGNYPSCFGNCTGGVEYSSGDAGNFLGGTENFPDGAPSRATRSFVETETGKVIGLLRGLGFFQKSDSGYASRFLRDLCERAALSPSEVTYLRAIIEKTAALAAHKGAEERKEVADDTPRARL